MKDLCSQRTGESTSVPSEGLKTLHLLGQGRATEEVYPRHRGMSGLTLKLDQENNSPTPTTASRNQHSGMGGARAGAEKLAFWH